MFAGYLASPLGAGSDRDRLFGFVGALSIHAFLLLIGGRMLIQPVSYGVQPGVSSMEVDLMTAPPSSVSEPVRAPVSEETKEPELRKPDTAPALDRPAVSSAVDGAWTAEAGYLRNPPPRYPELSRVRGEEGVVFLSVEVARDGRARSVRVRKSSGFDLLDRAALRSVREWQFEPARFGSLPIESKVEVPIRFKLDE